MALKAMYSGLVRSVLDFFVAWCMDQQQKRLLGSKIIYSIRC